MSIDSHHLKAYFQSILEVTTDNETMMKSWFEMVEESLMRRFEKNQQVPTSFKCAMHVRSRTYDTVVIDGLDTSDQSFLEVRSNNFYHGVPLMICSFVTTIKEGEDTYIFLTREVPFIRERKVYIVKDGKLIYDDYATKFKSFDFSITRFNSILIENHNWMV